MSSNGTAPKLSFGFKKAVPAIGAGAVNASKAAPFRRAAFGGGDDDDEDAALSAGPSTLSAVEKAKAAAKKKAAGPIGLGAGGKAPPSKAAAARQAEALQLDSSVFDYDGVYDAMKSVDRESKKKREEEAKKRDVS